MPESDKDNSGGNKFPAEGEDQTSDENQGAGDGGASSGEEGEEGGGDKGGDGGEKSAPKSDEGDEPVVRRSAKDFIIQRQQKKLQKQQRSQDAGDDDSDDGESDDGEELTPAARKALTQEVDNRVKPFLETVRGQSDEQELKETLAKYPNLKPLEKDIRKWMNHPAYAQASVELIALGLAAKKGKLADTAGKKQEADDEASAAKTGGNSRRPAEKPPGKIPDVTNMSDKEFDELVFKVKTSQFNP